MKKKIEFRTHLFTFAIFIYVLSSGYIYWFLAYIVNSRESNIELFTKTIHFATQSMLTSISLIIIFYLIYFFTYRKLVTKSVLVLIIYATFVSIILGLISLIILPQKIIFLLVAITFGISGALTKKYVFWRRTMNEKALSYKKLLESKTALLMLQAQLNPHFLFNSLNNIDVLIKETPDTASEYLKKLSDILRYVLYETKETETELSKEIDQIKSYIDLQKIRTDNPHYVNFNIKGEIKDQKIAPMIFIPFVENAFKHCKNKTIENAIDIEFEINNESIKMNCKNYFEEKHVEIIKSEGLGIETIKQRLNLLYPKNHELVIEKTGNWFNVSLTIKIVDGQMA